MCKCTPAIRTPFCGKMGCKWPEDEKEGVRAQEKEMEDMTPIQALRLLTGIFNPKDAITILTRVNLIARYLDHDKLLQDSFLRKQFEKIGINLILDTNKNKEN
jgi:hypothetical protein